MKLIHLTFALFLHAPFALAADPVDVNKPTEESCEARLEGTGKIEVFSSGRDDESYGDLKNRAQIITNIAHKLGLATPPHHIYFVPADQLNTMATTGGPAIPHWTDGLNIVRSQGSVSGVMEFVTPGCPTCRSYYSDGTSIIDQISVLMHVMGHNDMAVTSNYIKNRFSDGPAASKKLADLMQKLYVSVNHDEISLFVQRLKSLVGIQDYARGSFEHPDTFDPKHNLYPTQPEPSHVASGALSDFQIKGNKVEKAPSTQWHATPSVLQAFVKNLSPTAPQWQRDILKLLEEAYRTYPSIVSTKIMNEGWATFMEVLLTKHSPWNKSTHLVDFGQMFGRVAWPKLSNPYWVGVTGWMNIYDQYRRNNPHPGLTEIEKDKAFITWARGRYHNWNDYQFLKIAIDEEWIDKNRFFLYRKALRSEFDPSIPPEKQEYIALSRDPARIQRHIARALGLKAQYFPYISVRNFAETGSSKTHLEHNFSVGGNQPLEMTSAAKTLYVLSQIAERPTTIDTVMRPDTVTVYFKDWWGQESSAVYPIEVLWRWGMRTRARMEMMGITRIELPPPQTVRIEALPDGKIKVLRTRVTPATKEKKAETHYDLDPNYSEHLTGVVKDFIADTGIGILPELTDYERRRWDGFLNKTTDQTMNGVKGLINYAPTSSDAVIEYFRMLENRYITKLKLAIEGKIPVSYVKGGVGVQVLPEIPNFGFDRAYSVFKKLSHPVAPVDDRIMHGEDKNAPKELSYSPDVDDVDVEIAPGPMLPGDKFGIPKQPGKGGQGDGDGDPEDGEADDGDPSEDDSHNPGGGSGKPHDVVIPLEVWGEMLIQELDLPNIRRTDGKSPEIDKIRRGGRRNPAGNVLWDRTLAQALERVIGQRVANNLPIMPPEIDPMTLFIEAMKTMEQKDIIVSARTEKPRPDFDAIVVVNLDLTGSMMGERIQVAKNLVFTIRAMLKAKYPNVIFRFVGFDSTAEEYSEERIWKVFKGGGTAYAPPLQLTKKILSEYSDSKYNKYVLMLGDGETGDQKEVAQLVRELSQNLQYFGLAITSESTMWSEPLVNELKAVRQEWEWIGITQIANRSEIFRGIKELFPKGGQMVEK